jgi:hypothetical protein
LNEYHNGELKAALQWSRKIEELLKSRFLVHEEALKIMINSKPSEKDDTLGSVRCER